MRTRMNGMRKNEKRERKRGFVKEIIAFL